MRVLVAVVAVAAFLPVSAHAATVVLRTAKPVTAFAHDGPVIGWDVRKGRCRFAHRQNDFHLLDLDTGRRLAIPDRGGCVSRIAVGTSQVIWRAPSSASRSSTWTTGYEEMFPQAMRSFARGGGIGAYPLQLASDGGILTQSWMQVDYRDKSSCLDGGDCTKLVTGGNVEQISGFSRTAIPRARPAAKVAVYGGTVALQPIVIGSEATRPFTTDPIELRYATSGALEATVSPPGTVLAMAFGGGSLAVLVKASGAKQIRVYNAHTGALVVRHNVADEVAATLDMSVAGVLYRRGTELWLASRGAQRRTRVVTLTRKPRFLSIEGTTILWVTNYFGQGAIRTLIAPTV